MKKKIFLFVAAVAMLASCQTDDDLLTTGQDGKATGFVITTDDNLSTRYDISETDGEILLNENLFRTIDLYFFKRTSDAQSAPATSDRAAYHMSIDLTEESVQQYYDVECSFSKDVLKRIFGDELNNGTTCFVMAVVNKPANIDIAENTTRLEIFSKLVETASFATDVPNAPEDDPDTPDVDESLDYLNRFGVQDCFVMLTDNAVATLAKTDDKYSITGNAQVWRMASKFDLQVTQVSDTVTDAGGNLWRSFPEYMQVQFNNGVKKATMDTDIVPYIDQTNPTDSLPYEADYFDAKYRPFRLLEGVYEHHVPFYSYTNNWRKTTRRESYYSLMLPWRMLKADVAAAIKAKTRTLASLTDDDYQGARVNTYYQVPITTDADKRLKRNTYYISRLRVGVMGSFTVEDPVIITSSYIILPWGSASIKADMAEIAYLTVQYNTDTLNNINSHGVQYASSHPVTATFTKMEYYDYYESNSTDRIRKFVYEYVQGRWRRTIYDATTGELISTSTNISNPFTSSGPFGEFSVDVENGYVTLTHAIQDGTFVPVDVTVTVSNGRVADEQIIFTQYPAIYVSGHQSTAGANDGARVFVNTYYWNDSRSTYYSYSYWDTYWWAFDDRGYSDYYYNQRQIGVVVNPSLIDGSGSQNTNRNQYSIYISSLSDDKYTIGDPRGSENNLTYLRNLSHYRPASENVSMMLSPAYMLASSYGQGISMTYEKAQKRCAAYQEDGYPAGRWRIPTAGEIMFCVDLSNKNLLPSLFTTGSDSPGYWTSSRKRYRGGSLLDSQSDTRAFIRCVYDIWYWGKTHGTGTSGDTPMWGDATNFTWEGKTTKED